MASSDKIWAKLQQRLKNKSVTSDFNDCLVWVGATNAKNKAGYGKLRVRLPGQDLPQQQFAHRLAFMCKNKAILTPEQFISHLCGNKKCINTDHMNIEPIALNCDRIACFKSGTCFGHENQPNCLI